MKCSARTIQDVVIIEIDGDIMGGADTEKFQQLVYDAVENDRVHIVVDLAKSTWINSSGLGLLITGLTTARSSDGDLRLANVSPRIQRPLEITKLNTVFAIYPTVDDAVASYL